MQVDGTVVADAARAQVMGRGYAGIREDYLVDAVLYFSGQRFLQQLVHRGHQELDRHLHDEEADNDGGYRVEHPPAVAQQDGAADAHSGTDGRKSVAAMVPGVGHNSLRLYVAPHVDRILIESLLGDNGNKGGHQGQHARTGQRAPLDDVPDGLRPVPQDAQSHHKKAKPDDGGGQRLILAVAVVMTDIFGLGRQADEYQHDDVRHEVRKRVHGIGQHRCAMSRNAGKELEEQQHEVDHAAHKGHTINFALARRRIFCRSFHNASPFL